jgi:hypothetical protein|tara:strand:+ start:203 stop:412 length:210 start_codon:yes stop_codon:yes gene_type:complete
MINRELIIKGDIMYEIVSEVPAHMFLNKDKSINQQVLGMYVNDHKADRVLQREDKFLVCKQIEEAQIIT